MDALGAAYQNNPALLAERAALRATDEGVSQAVSGWRPTVQATGSIQTQDTPGFFPGSPTQTLNPKSLQLSASQPVFRGFRTVNGTKEAVARVEAGRATLQSREQDVLLSTVQAYVDVIRDLAVLELNANNVQVLERQLEATKDRFRVGEITRTDVAQSEARLSLAVSNRIASEASVTASRAAYKNVVGDAPGSLDPVPSLPGLPETEEAALEIALSRNPSLQAAIHTEEASRHAINTSKGSLLPEVNVEGSISDSWGSFRDGTVKSVAARITVPLYQSGAEHSRIRQAQQVNSQRRLQVEAARRQVVQGVSDAWNNLLSARAVIASSREAVRANEIALDGVRQEAAVGSRTTLDVLDAEQELLDSRVALVRAERNEYVAAYQLLSAVGHLTAGDLSLDVEVYDPVDHYDDVKNAFIGWSAREE